MVGQILSHPTARQGIFNGDVKKLSWEANFRLHYVDVFADANGNAAEMVIPFNRWDCGVKLICNLKEENCGANPTCTAVDI